MKECKCLGPDDLALVLIEVDKRRPSLLDSSPTVLFSEVHSAVYVVDSIASAAPFWKDAGLDSLLDATFSEPGVAEFMGLPRLDTRLRLTLLAGTDQAPLRLELIEFPDPDGRGAPLIPARPLRPGRFVFAFEVEDVAETSLKLSLATYSKTCRIGSEAVVAKLIHAVESPSPKARYKISPHTHAISLARRLLPMKVIDALMARS